MTFVFFQLFLVIVSVDVVSFGEWKSSHSLIRSMTFVFFQLFLVIVSVDVVSFGEWNSHAAS
jgi:hypothetical protein